MYIDIDIDIDIVTIYTLYIYIYTHTFIYIYIHVYNLTGALTIGPDRETRRHKRLQRLSERLAIPQLNPKH